MNFITNHIHIDLIRAGDTVLHCGEMRTVCPKDIRRGGFMGTTLFGDSYALGLQPVEMIAFLPAMEDAT